MDGEPGLVGLPGYSGSKGERGDEGVPGFPGLKGPTGEDGYPGRPGEEGDPPLVPRAESYIQHKGRQGDRGYPGAPGPTGPPGQTGNMGAVGARGQPGDYGYQGPPGRDGYSGGKGSRGDPGYNGFEGIRGFAGEPGYPGVPGYAGRNAASRGYFFTRHSQSMDIPRCPYNTSVLWTGYSFLYMLGNERAHGQDLGSPGSCLRRFSTMPYMFCNLNNVCNLASRNDYSYWLSTSEPMPMSMTPVHGQEIKRFISRCAVCETPTQVIAMHSQTMDIPECPRGWEGLWNGWSFIMVITL